MGIQKHQRRKYYVNPRLQGRIIGRFAAYWCVYHLVLLHAMFLYRYWQYRDMLASGARSVTVLDYYFGFLLQNTTLIVCACFVFPLFIWDVFMLSHRIAGPLVRFQNTLRRMADGDRISHIELRKGDLLFDLKDSFNDYLDSLHGTTDGPGKVNAFDICNLQNNARTSAGESCRTETKTSAEFESIVHDLRDIGTTVRNVKSDDTLAGPSLEALEQELKKS